MLYLCISLQCLGFLLHILKINGKWKPYNHLWVKRSKVNLPATFCLHFISDRISLHLLITDTSDFVKIWRMIIGRHSEHQRTKLLLVKVSNACFPIELCVYAILVNCASISAPCMRFIIKVRWTFYVLEYFLSMALIILHTYHMKDEISCKSCNSLKMNFLSLASLNLVQSRHFYLTTIRITFTSVKMNMFLHMIKWYGKVFCILSFARQYSI